MAEQENRESRELIESQPDSSAPVNTRDDTDTDVENGHPADGVSDQEPESIDGTDRQTASESDTEEMEETKSTEDTSTVTPTDESPKQEKSESLFSLSSLFDYIEILVFSVVAVLLIFTLGFRLCRVDGSSMRNTLVDNQMLITTSLVEPKRGDIIVFHMTSDTYEHFNESLVKRIIAVGGQTVRYDYNTMKVYVDGEEVDDSWAWYLDRSGNEIGVLTQYPAYDYDINTGIFETTVPEGYLFVMGDNRNNSADSRTVQVGFVDERRVLGKVVIRLGESLGTEK